MNYELRRICKEAVVAWQRYYHGICLKRLRKTAKKTTRIAVVPD
jgi:hypothetical protein